MQMMVNIIDRMVIILYNKVNIVVINISASVFYVTCFYMVFIWNDAQRVGPSPALGRVVPGYHGRRPPQLV
jgi:hypothetical protein